MYGNNNNTGNNIHLPLKLPTKIHLLKEDDQKSIKLRCWMKTEKCGERLLKVLCKIFACEISVYDNHDDVSTSDISSMMNVLSLHILPSRSINSFVNDIPFQMICNLFCFVLLWTLLILFL